MTDVDAAIALMKAKMEVHGVASAKVEDGEVFMFSREKIESLIRTMDENQSDSIVIFVQTGPLPVRQ